MIAPLFLVVKEENRMYIAQNATVLNERLVEEIRKDVQDETILNAFRMVPRHEFVPVFYTRTDDASTGQQWHRVTRNDQQWLEEVYKNRPLTTSIDRNGDPNISSSQPALLAQMLQSLHLQRGHRVLEIGTGTGYTAAILGYIVGSEKVVTLDINQALLEEARVRIERTGGSGRTILHADGRTLPEYLGEFQAILVTGSHDRIEPSWVRALVPGGRIVFNWIQGLTKVMLEAEKTEERLIGRVSAYGGDFMQLHDGNVEERVRVPHQRLGLVTCQEFRPQIFEDPDFSFLLQIALPSLRYRRYRNASGEKSYAVRDLSGHRLVHFFPGKIRGDGSLWEEIRALHETFEQLLRPSRKAFSLCVDERGCMTFSYKDYVFRVQ
jgi:protein-L-isoaspartate O-methyltransferase